jgi:diguanylate cyclase (GGDEF)-like protein
MHEKIENLAIKDGLTDIYNHRYFQETLIKEFEKSVRDNSNLSLIFIDIDNFKQYNDTYGHAEGDRLLQNITKLINNNLDEIATFARYGGEEFVILLPGINKKEAFITAEKIRKLVEEHTFSSADNTINQKITISLGVSNYPEDVKRPESLTDIADKGLYLAKKSGKNKVCIYT